VVEGCGSNGCEYMTGGVAVILGSIGANFGAGMTGGMAFVWDERGDFDRRANPENIVWQPLRSHHWEGVVKDLVMRHASETDSPRAKEILRTWEESRGRFVQVAPKEMLDKLGHPLDDSAAALAGE
jgi:glutamate synthase (NADPH/NADH) large chain